MPKKKDDYICVLGGCNMDIIGFPYKNFVPEDRIRSIKAALGGVGRNIAENLVHLGIPTKLISAIAMISREDNPGACR